MHHGEARIFRVLAKMVVVGGCDVFTLKRDTTLRADVYGSCDG